jgi:hypothetical protein
MSLINVVLWTPVLIIWVIRFIEETNPTINWLFVLFSNVSMLGPIFGYWLSILIIPIGWAAEGSFTWEALTRLFCWIIVSFFASFF